MTLNFFNPTIVSGTFTGVENSAPIVGHSIDILGTGTGTINIEEKIGDTWVVLEALASSHCVYDAGSIGQIRLASTAGGANFSYILRSVVNK